MNPLGPCSTALEGDAGADRSLVVNFAVKLGLAGDRVMVNERGIPTS
jgi:hypothetical protein